MLHAQPAPSLLFRSPLGSGPVCDRVVSGADKSRHKDRRVAFCGSDMGDVMLEATVGITGWMA
jgi:hypothetical protein